MVAPWQETAIKVVVEFKKGNQGTKRVINLTHRPDALPPQLYGRVPPEAWGAFMTEVGALAQYHPYIQRQSAEQCCFNLGGVLSVFCVGFGCFEPDGGSYARWTGEVQNTIAHHAAAFAPGGCTLSLQQVHGNFFIQIDINPNMAVGMPMGTNAALPPPPGAPSPYPYPYPAAAAPPPAYPQK